jgi:hypothetical protein
MVNPFTTLFRQLCTPPLPATHMTIEIPQMKEVAFRQYKRQLYKSHTTILTYRETQLYNSNNQLVDYSDWYYNGTSVAGISRTKSGNSYAHGYYYSKGQTAAYNGSGYTVYNTFQSPNLYF